MWYTIYRSVDGGLIGHTAVAPGPLPPGVSMKSHEERMDQANVWNPVTTGWEPRPVSRLVRPGQVFNALTPLELKALCESAGAGVSAFFRGLDILERGGEPLDKDGPVASQLLQWLVDDGVLTPARKAELLA